MTRRRRLLRALVWTSAGAATVYLFDPDLGRTRRARFKDQVAGRLRRADRNVRGKARYVASTAEGKVQQATQSDATAPADDRTLVDKIRSEVLGHAPFENRSVIVDAVNGVVTLRGELPEASLVESLGRAVQDVPGVREVRNLVHLPGSPAPNKEDALQAPGQ